MAGVPLTQEQTARLSAQIDVLLDFTDEKAVKDIYSSTDNWDIVKNCTEIMVFGAALKMLDRDGELESVHRIHKISGRYALTDAFDVSIYEQNDKIVVAKQRPSQFPPSVTGGQQVQYMSRLWSWPREMLPEIVQFYDTALEDFGNTVARGQYLDIEHLLAKHLPQSLIMEVDPIGVSGTIGPTGNLVID